MDLDDDIDFVGSVIDDIFFFDWPEGDIAAYVRFYQALSKPQRMIWSTWCVQGAVQNGGFGAYFPGIHDDCYVDDALIGFHAIGQTRMLEIFRQVIDYRREHEEEIAKAKDYDEYSKIMGWIPLWELSGSFCDEIADFYVKRRKYITANIDQFTIADPE